MLKNFSRIIILLAFAAVAGCSAIDTTSTILVSPTSKIIGLGGTQQFFATAYNSQNQLVSKTFTWGISGTIGTIDASGYFYAGNTAATGYVIASAEGISGSSSVQVTDKGIITGILQNSHQNTVSNMSVYIMSTPAVSAFSGSNGSYTLNNVPTGTQDVAVAESLLYLLTTAETTISTGESKTINITLLDRFTIGNENINNDPLIVSGDVNNNGTKEAKNVTVMYTFYDDTGVISDVGQASVGNMPAGSTRSYTFTTTISTYFSVTRAVTTTGF